MDGWTPGRPIGAGLTAVLQLVFGPLSDRYGRRPVVLGCFVVFLVATLGTMAATTPTGSRRTSISMPGRTLSARSP